MDADKHVLDGELVDEQTTAEEKIECEAEALDTAVQDRLWLRMITHVLAARSAETDPCERVQKAIDRMIVAAAERAARILRADMLDVR